MPLTYRKYPEVDTTITLATVTAATNTNITIFMDEVLDPRVVIAHAEYKQRGISARDERERWKRR